MSTTELPSSTDLRAAVEAQRWYHTIDLPDGVVTPGQFDTRTAVGRFPFPASLEGKRCLDVGTSDGFWAFEMERRGAAEVVALDIDDPLEYDWPEPLPRPGKGVIANQEAGPNQNFLLAHEALGSKVERVVARVYDITPEMLGTFDFVYMGTLLLHLRDPVLAMSRIRPLVRGEFMSGESISLVTTILLPRTAAGTLVGANTPRWWTPNMVAHRRLVAAAGFDIVDGGGPYFMPFGPGQVKRRIGRGMNVHDVLFELSLRRVGIPHAWLRTRPMS